MAEPKQQTHEEKCIAARDPKLEKWVAVGQTLLQEPTGRNPIFITTLFCKFCGNVHMSITPVSLPAAPAVTVPKLNVNQKN